MTNETIIVEIKTKYNLLNVNEPIWNDLIEKARAEGRSENKLKENESIITNENLDRIRNCDICDMCQSEDFGYCGRRNEEIELKYENDKKGNLIKCSGFVANIVYVNRIFRLKVKEVSQ